MFEGLKKLLGGKKGPSVIGIDIGASCIKVVQLRKDKGRAVLETYGEIALGPYMDKAVGQIVNLPPETIVVALNDLLREAKVTTDNAGVSIPLASSLISLIELPVIDPAQLSTMVPLEARKYIPVPISEVILDWHVMPPHAQTNQDIKDKGPRSTDVLLVAIHKDTIARYQSIVEAVRLSVSFFEIEVFSTIRSSIDRGIQPTLIVDFGASSTKLYIVEAGIVRDSHIINQGGQDITLSLSRAFNLDFPKAEELKRSGIEGSHNEQIFSSLQYILSEIRRVVQQYERKYNVPIVDVFFSGGGSLLVNLLPKAVEIIDANIKIVDPFAKTETPAILADVLQEAGPEFAVAIGAALRKLEELS